MTTYAARLQEEHPTAAPDGKVWAAGVRFQAMGKVYHFDASEHLDLQAGDFVLVETVRGRQLGEVVALVLLDESDQHLKPVQRRATGRELALRQQLQRQEESTLETAREIAAENCLPIKLVVAEYTFDGQRLTLLYVSEDKNPSLASLTRQLESRFDVHVDLRRIGPRDQAKLMKGYGACGELRCCNRFLSDFRPVSIRMAKAQGVSLNPVDITGICGRLRCCLTYEHELYKEAVKKMPRRKKWVRTPHGEGRVIDLLPLKDIVVVRIEDRRVEVPLDEVEVISK
ncbi:MAG TPA: stage 0 sporulation family protein [Chloroflexi bacterium]|nr:stage 0 sporulation family protein [Chloroflexota bacterium]